MAEERQGDKGRICSGPSFYPKPYQTNWPSSTTENELTPVKLALELFSEIQQWKTVAVIGPGVNVCATKT